MTNRIAEHLNTDITFIVLPRGNERYVVIFDDKHRAETLRVIGRWAANPELGFTWYNAAIMSQQIRASLAKTKGDKS